MVHGRFALKLAVFAVTFLVISTSAWADIVTVNVTGQVWQVYGNWGNAPTAAPVASGTSTNNVPVIKQTEMSFSASQVNFSAYGSDTLQSFLNSGGATGLSNTTGASDPMSNCTGSAFNSSPSCYSTVIEITGTFNFQGGYVYGLTHDDGVVMFANGNKVIDSRTPTSAETDTFAGSAADNGNFQIWYMATNGNPEVLQLSQTDVPDGGMTLMLLGGALVGLETLRRKFRV